MIRIDTHKSNEQRFKYPCRLPTPLFSLSVKCLTNVSLGHENSVENDVQFCSYTRNEYGHRRKRDNLDEKMFKM